MEAAALDSVRMSEIEKKALTEAIAGIDGEVYVFGSRVVKESKGGDIDILVIPRTSSQSEYRLSQEITLRFQRVCEEKIDVVVFPRQMTTPQRAFFETASKARIK